MEALDQHAWVQFFCAVKGWQHHPGVKQALTTEQCAKEADRMLEQFLIRKSQWDTWQQR